MTNTRMAILAVCFVVARGVEAVACPQPAEANTVMIETSNTAGFGSYQKMPPLPLEKGEYVLTFDDGPYRPTLPLILDILETRCVPATFFMIGRKAEKNPDLVKEVKAKNFGIASHSFSHRTLTDLPLLEAEKDIAEGMLTVEKAAGGLAAGQGRLFRFPSSAMTPELIAYVRELGATVAGVDLSPEDWRGSPPEESLDRFRKRINTQDRGVIVLHDSQPNTVALLPMIIDEVHARGGRFVRLEAHGSALGLE